MKLLPLSFLDKGFDLFFDVLKVCAHNVLIDFVIYKGSKFDVIFPVNIKCRELLITLPNDLIKIPMFEKSVLRWCKCGAKSKRKIANP